MVFMHFIKSTKAKLSRIQAWFSDIYILPMRLKHTYEKNNKTVNSTQN